MLERAPKIYFVPVDTECLPDCRLCLLAGCRNSKERSLENVRAVIERAKSGEYTGVEFSSRLLMLDPGLRREIVEYCRKCNLGVSVQLDWSIAALAINAPEINEWNFLLTEEDRVVDQELVERAGVRFTVYPKDVNASLEFVEKNKLIHKKLRFHFSPYSETCPHLSVREIHFFIEKLKKLYPEFKVLPPLGREVWDYRIDPGLGLDSSICPRFASVVDNSQVEFSIIIPSFNSRALLKNVLRHLVQQKYERTLFEIIVVDDGSTDGTEQFVKNFLAAERGDLNYTYLYFPRNRERRRGDGNFRAGIARNQGVKAAKGKYLCFLDSDIIVPPDYLLRLKELHERFDVIQNVRLHLKNKKKNYAVSYELVNPQKDTFILEGSYWGKLFECSDWESLPFFWKYTCTYSLSLSKELFLAAGGFKKTFVYYGFEDTDLGYRLWKMGAKFHLSKILTYHLETDEDRTEYRKSGLERHLVLSKTAKVFYLNNLDSDIFLHFYSMMGGEKGVKYYSKKLISGIGRRLEMQWKRLKLEEAPGNG